jgi:small subunit ribosomal protein S6
LANKRVYEVMYIVAPETADDDVTKLNESITQVIEKEGGTVANTDNMGRRRLAYPINKKTEGHYVLMEVEGSGKEIFELERRMRVNDAIIRFITVRVDEDRKTADKHKAKRERRHDRRDAESNKGSQNADAEQSVENQ